MHDDPLNSVQILDENEKKTKQLDNCDTLTQRRHYWLNHKHISCFLNPTCTSLKPPHPDNRFEVFVVFLFVLFVFLIVALFHFSRRRSRSSLEARAAPFFFIISGLLSPPPPPRLLGLAAARVRRRGEGGRGWVGVGGGQSLIKQIISCWGRERLHFRAPPPHPPLPLPRPVLQEKLFQSPSPSSPVSMFVHWEVRFYIFILLAHMRSYCCWWVQSASLLLMHGRFGIRVHAFYFGASGRK